MNDAVSMYLRALADHAHPEGGWGYSPGQTPQIEPTCFALLALDLERDRHRALLDKGLAFLDRCAAPDGSYRLAHGRAEAIWPTALVLFTKHLLQRNELQNSPLSPPGRGAGGEGPSLQATASFLLGVKGKVPDSQEAGELHDIDIKINGWPWAEDNFAWVEPTAWACLALRCFGAGDQPRVQEGLRLLLDRAMDEGGINYGNRRILGRMTEPMPGPTALMLLALQPEPGSNPPTQGQGRSIPPLPAAEGEGRGDRTFPPLPPTGGEGRGEGGIATPRGDSALPPRVAAAVQYLLKQVDTGDVDYLCWAKLTLELYPDEPGVREALSRLDDLILAANRHRQETPYLRPALLRLALSALALGSGRRNPFRLPAAPPTSVKLTPADVTRKRSLGQRFGAWFRGLAVKAAGQMRPLPNFSGVHIARADDYNANLADILHKQFEHFRAHVPLQGKRVVLKPNLVEWHRDKVINTNPQVVAAVIELCRREGAGEIIVAEGPGHCRNVEYLVAASGLGEVLARHGVPFVDLNHDEPVKTPNMGRLTGLEYLYLSRTIATAEVVISLPKLKTHHWAGATLSLKNLFGTLPGICYGWPKNELHWRGIDNSIVDIALTRTPELAIVDGIVAMEGDGPLNGTAKPFGALIMGHDLVALDATCCRLMMLDPEKIGYLVLGHMKKLGRMNEAEIPQLGEPIAALAQPFATVPHLDRMRLKRSA